MLTNINRFSTLLGFEKTLAPMRAAKAALALEHRYRYTFHDGDMNETGKEVLSEAEFIVYALQEGRRTEARIDRPCRKCVASYCAGDACTKGKPTYHMWAEKHGNEITKTGYNFAQWLISEGLTSFDAVQERIDAEKAAQELAVQEAAQNELERQAAAEAEQLAESEYKAWLNDAAKNYGGINTPEGEKILILRDIFLDIHGEYYEHAIKFLVQIDNIENPRCRRDIISRLHGGNVASIKTFEHITGIKLAKTNKERAAQLETVSSTDFTLLPKPYKLRKTAEQADYSAVFYKKQFAGDGSGKPEFVETRGRLWQYGSYDFYITVVGQKEKKYTVTEGKTGFSTSSGNTLKEAQDITRDLVNNMHGGKPLHTPFAEMVRQSIEKEGLSPLYK